ncbi:MAG: HAMP domain-containing histidine kinase [Gemmatimonadaceae bacterium]|nr:HAMP domain-containing histidine kinase [Gemmatimonadaceae bacterium]
MSVEAAHADRHLPRIRLRVTMMYASTLLVVLLAMAVVLRLAMRDALRRELDNSAHASAALVSQFFRVEIAEYQTIEATLTHIAGELAFEDRVMHIRRPDGAEFTVVGEPRPRHRPITAPVRRVVAALEPALAPSWNVEVEVSLASVEAIEDRIDRGIAMGIPALVLLAAASGWWLTGRTLRPVGRMAVAASQLVPGTHGRLPIDDETDELGRLGLRFNTLLDRVETALQQQRRFLADAAHELRTPLARVRSRVEVAMLPSDATRAAYPNGAPPETLSAIHEELVRMSRLVDELLQLARADASGNATPDAMTPLFLDDVVTDELHRWRADAEQARSTLRCSVLQEAPICGNAVLLQRLLGILLDNALRYGRPGGYVDVRVDLTEALVVLSVEDDGIGISPEEQGQLFDRFYRGDRARARRADGSGLGLAIAAWIVERHGGSISVEPRPQESGTLAQVTLKRLESST